MYIKLVNIKFIFSIENGLDLVNDDQIIGHKDILALSGLNIATKVSWSLVLEYRD
jgi:hypothetical protein